MLIAMEQHLGFLERPFADGRIDDEIAALAEKEKNLVQQVSLQQQNYDIEQEKYQQGGTSELAVFTARIPLTQTQAAQLDAQLASSQAKQKKTDMLANIASAKAKIAADKACLAELMNGLTVIARANGTFYPNVGVNSFVRKGDVLGSIVI